MQPSGWRSVAHGQAFYHPLSGVAGFGVHQGRSNASEHPPRNLQILPKGPQCRPGASQCLPDASKCLPGVSQMPPIGLSRHPIVLSRHPILEYIDFPIKYSKNAQPRFRAFWHVSGREVSEFDSGEFVLADAKEFLYNMALGRRPRGPQDLEIL